MQLLSASEPPEFVEVDLRPIMSAWADPTLDKYYHLHPACVDAAADDTGATAMLCERCVAGNDKKEPYAYSIAAGVDYGLLSRVPELEPLSDMERMLLSEQRLYQVIMSVSGKYGTVTSSQLKGNIIT